MGTALVRSPPKGPHRGGPRFPPIKSRVTRVFHLSDPTTLSPGGPRLH